MIEIIGFIAQFFVLMLAASLFWGLAVIVLGVIIQVTGGRK